MFWTIALALTLEWLVAMAFGLRFGGLIHGLLVLAGLSVVMALGSGAARLAAHRGAQRAHGRMHS